MKTIYRRLERLEEPVRLAAQKCRVWAVRDVYRKLALDTNRCLEILDECGYFPKTRFAVAHFNKVPDGLNAHETEAFLREHGAELF